MGIYRLLAALCMLFAFAPSAAASTPLVSYDLDGTGADSSGNHRHATLTNLSFEDGVDGGLAGRFRDGYAQRDEPLLTHDFTLDLWAKVDGSQAGVMAFNGTIDSNGYGVMVGGGQGFGGFMRPGHCLYGVLGGVGYIGTTFCFDTDWHHIQMVGRSGGVYLYVDEQLVGSDGVRVYKTPETAFTLGMSLFQGSPYYQYAGLIDNVRLYGEPLTVGEEPPETTITAGPSGTVPDSTASFSFEASKPSTFQCRLNASTWEACQSPAVYNDLHGTYTFEVRATDSGNRTDPTPASRTFTVASNPPDTGITEAPPQVAIEAGARFVFDGSGVGPFTFECKLDDAAWAACTSPYDTTVSDGQHAFAVRATDTFGRTDPTPAAWNWSVDTAPPDTILDSAPPDPSGVSVAFSFRSNRSDVAFSCRIDDGDWHRCRNPYAVGGLEAGEHTFMVRATTSSGVTDPTPAIYTWTVLGEPDTIVDEAPSGAVEPGAHTIRFHGVSEAGVSHYQCRVDREPGFDCSSPLSRDYMGGEHVVTIAAVDSLGQTDPTPAVVTFSIPPEDSDGDGDPDNDEDAVFDRDDNCPNDSNSGQEDIDGDEIGDICDPDRDGDDRGDDQDNCPSEANPAQEDADRDEVGDVCDGDDDNDDQLDPDDNCPAAENPQQEDADGDEAGDACDPDDDNDLRSDPEDNCPTIGNADQVNTDGDGRGDACDADDDNDGRPDVDDNCSSIANDQADRDEDGLGDACDPDDDGDGRPDTDDNCPIHANADQADRDADGLGDVCDPNSGPVPPAPDPVKAIDTECVNKLIRYLKQTVEGANKSQTGGLYQAARELISCLKVGAGLGVRP